VAPPLRDQWSQIIRILRSNSSSSGKSIGSSVTMLLQTIW
jgi:hypothetical protein